METLRVLTVLGNAVKCCRSDQQDSADGYGNQAAEMDPFEGLWKAIKILHQKDHYLEAEQGLSARKHHAGLSEHLLDLVSKRRAVIPVLIFVLPLFFCHIFPG